MKKTISMPIPKAYQVPEGTNDGDTFDVSCTFRLEGKTMELESVDGVSVDSDDKKEKNKGDSNDAAQQDLAGRYAAAMGGGPAQSPAPPQQ